MHRTEMEMIVVCLQWHNTCWYVCV